MNDEKTSNPRRSWTSASNAEADSLCPGRHLAQQGLAETTSKDAEFGAQLHEALATDDTADLDLVQQDLHETCEQIVDNVGAIYFGTDWGAVRQRPFKEQRYWTKFADKSKNPIREFEHSGQCDRVYRSGQRALIFEFKSLAGDIPGSPTNLQLRDQAVLVRGHFLVDSVATVVVQPLVTHSPQICVYEKKDLIRAETEMFKRVIQSNTSSLRVAGDIQCKFCRAKTHCAEHTRFAGSKLPVPVSILDVPMTEWTAQQCALFLDNRALAQRWLDDAVQTIKDRLKTDSEAIPGWGLKDGTTKETIKDAQVLFERFAAIGGKLEKFMDCVAIGKTRFKKAVNAATGKKGNALEQTLKTLYEGIVETKKNAPSIERKDGK